MVISYQGYHLVGTKALQNDAIIDIEDSKSDCRKYNKMDVLVEHENVLKFRIHWHAIMSFGGEWL